MNLKEKVDLLRAARGVLVAPALSRDAQALLLQPQYNRIDYRKCSSSDIEGLRLHLMHIVHDPLQITASVTARTMTGPLPDNLKDRLFRWVVGFQSSKRG